MKNAKTFRVILSYAVLCLVAVVMAGPFVWMVFSSVKPNEDLFAHPPVWFPQRVTGEHFRAAFAHTNLPRYFLNSLIVAGVATVTNVLFGSLAGFAFARLEFPGRDVIFFAILGTMMVPIHVTVVPLFILAKRFPLAGGNNILGVGGTGLIDTYGGLLFPYLITAFGVFMTRQFFASLPRELDDAARIDGCSDFGIFAKICLPLSRPVIATLSIFTFTNVWDDFLWPLVIINRDEMRTVQLGLQVFQSQFSVDWGPLMAATLMVTVPVLIVFILGQDYFVEGIATTGMKG
ncbi:MAG TPA: carbohydrate ABC transporter permease [Bacillota bacterium]|jgi:multiple sugar transport system permease protein|nr:carbohydrate ABC transporter permease [Bacillota bacterium]